MKLWQKAAGVFGVAAAASAMMAAPSGADPVIDQIGGAIFTATTPTLTVNGSVATSRCLQPGGTDPETGNVDSAFQVGAIITQGDCTGGQATTSLQLYKFKSFGTVTAPSSVGGFRGLVFQFKDNTSGECLESRSGGTGSGVIDQVPCATTGTTTANDKQLWFVTDAATGDPNGTTAPFNLKPWSAVRLGANVCAEVKDGSGDVGAFLQQAACNGSDAQKFYGKVLELRHS